MTTLYKGLQKGVPDLGFVTVEGVWPRLLKAAITKHIFCDCQHPCYTPGPASCLSKMRSPKEYVSVLLAVRTHPQPRHSGPTDLE